VAEEIRKLEEEERQRWEAEHRAEAVRQVQAPESLMRVDDGDAEEETETKKGKGKETGKEAEKDKNGWMIVGGSGRCNACRKEDMECEKKSGRDREVAEEHGEREGVQEGTARHLLPEVHGDEVEALFPSGHSGMLTEDGEIGEANEADCSAFCQFGQEEAFGGRGEVVAA